MTLFLPGFLLLSILCSFSHCISFELSVIITTKKRRELQRPSKILLRSMAVSDLIVGGISMPLSAIIGLLLPHRIMHD